MSKDKWAWRLVYASIIILAIGTMWREERIDTRLDKLAAQQVTTSAQIDSLTMLGMAGANYALFDARSDRWSDSLVQARIDSMIYQDEWNRRDLQNQIHNLKAQVERLDREIPKPEVVGYRLSGDSLLEWGPVHHLDCGPVHRDVLIAIERYVREQGGKP